MSFAGQGAVITGAASGLGKAFAVHAASLGMKLVVTDVDESALNEISDSLRSKGAQIHPVACDVSNAEDFERLVIHTNRAIGTPNLVINNAGVASRNGLIWEAERSEWEWVWGVNVMGVANGIRAFVPPMLAASRSDPSFSGRIVNVASMGGLFNPTLCGVYSASKHAVVSMSETLYHDLNVVSSRVGCSVVCPFFVSTNINRADEKRPERFRRLQSPTPSQVIGQDFADSGMLSAKISTEEISEFVFNEISNNKFYIIPHPSMMKSVSMRMEDVIGMNNPREPFSFRPEIAERLQKYLRTAS